MEISRPTALMSMATSRAKQTPLLYWHWRVGLVGVCPDVLQNGVVHCYRKKWLTQHAWLHCRPPTRRCHLKLRSTRWRAHCCPQRSVWRANSISHNRKKFCHFLQPTSQGGDCRRDMSYHAVMCFKWRWRQNDCDNATRLTSCYNF